MDIRYVSHTSKGLVRENNEDSLITRVGSDKALFAVADGMGGCFGGEIASTLLIDRLGECWEKTARKSVNTDNYFEDIKLAIRGANDDIYSRYSLKGEICGTTLVLIAISGNVMMLMNIGDSRCYSLYGLNLRRETIDHVYIEDERRKKNGKDLYDVMKSGKKDFLTSAVGCNAMYKFDLKTMPLKKGRFFLCSDGVYKYVPDIIIGYHMLHYSYAQRAISKWVEAKGAGDNYTYILIDIRSK